MVECHMQLHDSYFGKHKQNALQKYYMAKKEGKVDTLIIHLLDKINEMDIYFTTSSCAGRIVVLQLPRIGDKKNACFLGKWHHQINERELMHAVDCYDTDQLWLLGQPPIFHIGCQSIEAADQMIKLGISSGLKHSGIKSIQDQIIVELCSTERIDMPIGDNGILQIDKEFLLFLLKKANRMITRAQEKLKRFEKNLQSLSG